MARPWTGSRHRPIVVEGVGWGPSHRNPEDLPQNTRLACSSRGLVDLCRVFTCMLCGHEPASGHGGCRIQLPEVTEDGMGCMLSTGKCGSAQDPDRLVEAVPNAECMSKMSHSSREILREGFFLPLGGLPRELEQDFALTLGEGRVVCISPGVTTRKTNHSRADRLISSDASLSLTARHATRDPDEPRTLRAASMTREA